MTPAKSRPKQAVEIWFDPVCPWAWLTSRWLTEAAQVRDIDVSWSVMSLAVLNDGRHLPQEYQKRMEAAWGPVRVITAAALAARRRGHQAPLRRHGHAHPPGPAPGLRRRHRRGTGRLRAAGCARQGGRPEEHDAALKRSHKRAISLVGLDVGTPVIEVEGVAFFGPVVTPAPKGEAAGKLWDGCVLVAATPGFYELKRTRSVGPILD